MPVEQREDPSTTLQLPSTTNHHPVFFTDAEPTTSTSSKSSKLTAEAAEADGGGRGGPAVPCDDVATHKPLSQITPPCIFGGGTILHVGGDYD